MNASISRTPSAAQTSTISLGLGRRSSPAASRTGRACRPGPPRSSTPRAGGWAAGCRRRRRRGRRAASSYDPYARGIPSSRGGLARRGAASREAIATTSHRSAFWVAGMTLSDADVRGRQDAPAQHVAAHPHDASRHRPERDLEDPVVPRARQDEQDGLGDVLRRHHARRARACRACDPGPSRTRSPRRRGTRSCSGRPAAAARGRARASAPPARTSTRSRRPRTAGRAAPPREAIVTTSAPSLRSRWGSAARSGVERALHVDVDHLLDLVIRQVQERAVRAHARR